MGERILSHAVGEKNLALFDQRKLIHDVFRRRQPAQAQSRGKDAETWLNAKLREIELGEFVAPTTTTVGELLDLWLAGKRGDIADRTYTDYKYAIETYIRPRLGSIQASKLSSKHLKLHYEYLRDECGLSNRTVRHIHILIKAALGEAVRHRQ